MSSFRAILDDPGDFIAALPAMLGFVPERSLLVAVLKGSACHPPADTASVFAVLRFDLDQPDDLVGDPVEHFAGAIARICAFVDSTEVLAVIVDDRVTLPASPRGDADGGAHAALITALDHRLVDAGIGLVGAWVTAAIESDQPWSTLLGHPDHGLLPDPTASTVTVAVTAKGEPIFASRSELVSLVEPDQQTMEQVDRLLPSARSTIRRRYAARRRGGDPDGATRRELERALGLIAAFDSGCLPTVSQTAQVAAALADRRVRNGLLATALSIYARSAESLWSHLTRTLPSPERAEAATLLAYSAYVRGNGPLAGIALQTALDADPYHHLAVLLEAALEMGLDPVSMRRLGRSGAEIVRGLGIEIELPDASS